MITKQYNYKFENFYVVVIQQAYRNYKKKSESLVKQVWKIVRNDSISDNKKFLDIIPCSKTYHFINRKLIEFNYMSNWFYVENKYNIYFATTWVEVKRNQLYRWLNTIIYIVTFKVLY